MSMFSGINMMSRAMRSFQLALETSGHNVSNVDTPGYSRQRVEFATSDPTIYYDQGWRGLGQGVHVSRIGRLRDLFLERSSNDSSGSLGKFRAAVTGLQSIEKVYGEPSDQGVVAALGKFFDSWSGLASNPSDQGQRFSVRNSGQVLADRIRGAWKALDQQAADQKPQIDAILKNINDLASKVDSLNKAVRGSIAEGSQPGDLLDQRDAAVAEMSKLVNVQTSQYDDGTLAVFAAGFTVVDSAGTMPFPSSYDPVAGTVTNGTITNPVRTGELAGLFVQSNEIASQKTKLDDLANTLRTQINAIHMTGQTNAGVTNLLFFNDVPVPPQTGAIDFDLDPLIRADVSNIVTGVSPAPGDGGLAHSLSDLRDVSMAALGSKTFSGYVQDNVSTLASKVAYFDQALTTELSVYEQIQNQIQSVSGVSIDDEMADMVKFQRSYQAAAKTLSTLDSMTEDLLGMLHR